MISNFLDGGRHLDGFLVHLDGGSWEFGCQRPIWAARYNLTTAPKMGNHTQIGSAPHGSDVHLYRLLPWQANFSVGLPWPLPWSLHNRQLHSSTDVPSSPPPSLSLPPCCPILSAHSPTQPYWTSPDHLINTLPASSSAPRLPHTRTPVIWKRSGRAGCGAEVGAEAGFHPGMLWAPATGVSAGRVLRRVRGAAEGLKLKLET